MVAAVDIVAVMIPAPLLAAGVVEDMTSEAVMTEEGAEVRLRGRDIRNATTITRQMYH